MVSSTNAEPATLALVFGGATGHALGALEAPARGERRLMGRKILLVTTDQQRFDTLGCNGGTLARTPVVDGLAATGIRYERAHPQSVVCMPSRSTIITGQHPSTHGVWMNGVPLPVDAPSVAAVLHDAGYRTALIGKAHFEPFIDPFGRFTENMLARDRRGDPCRARYDGTTGPIGASTTSSSPPTAPWARCTTPAGCRPTTPRRSAASTTALDAEFEVNAAGGGDTDAPQVKANPIERGWYHTDWVADRTMAWLDSLDADDDWFCWMSFPDPHHPWDPPAVRDGPGRLARRRRCRPGTRRSRAERERILDAKPRHWRAVVRRHAGLELRGPGRVGAGHADRRPGARGQRPQRGGVRADRRGAGPRARRASPARGWGDDVDVIFTTDHGELQGDFGLLFKGPYHVDAPDAAAPGVAPGPVALRRDPGGGHPAGRDWSTWPPRSARSPGWTRRTGCRAGRLPVDDADADARGFERVLTEWDSELFGVGVHLRTITRDGWVCTTYRPGAVHDGTEGELYDLADDPLQQINRWDDPAVAGLQADLVADLWDHDPPAHQPHLALEAPV